MDIVVLDGHTLNPGDLSWRELQELGSCKIYDRTNPDMVLERASHAAIVLTNKTVLQASVIDRLPLLKYIGVLATGYNVVDTEAARKRNIPVTNVPGYGTQSVAQMVFAHLLNLTLHVAQHGQAVVQGKWSANQDFCFWDFPLIELAGLNLGILGLGRIGRAVAKLADAFGMQVLYTDPGSVPDPPAFARRVDLLDLFRESDVLSLHCPLTEETRQIVNSARLRLMKSTAFLINTSRGPLIDETALADALNQGRIAGAGLDVLCMEPPPHDHPLITAKNCCITPHIAWATRMARHRLMQTAVANVHAFLQEQPQNVVNM